MTETDLDKLAELVADRLAAKMAPHVSKWLTVKEAMQYAKACENTIMAWINKGYIYAFRRTGKWVIDRESIDRWYSMER